MRTITTTTELINSLADQIRNNPSQITCSNAISRMFDRHCANILRNGGFSMFEVSDEMPSMDRFFEELFEEGFAPSIVSRPMLKFVGIVSQDIIVNVGEADFLNFPTSVRWFLEALGWDERILRLKGRFGDQHLKDTAEFRELMGCEVRVPVPVVSRYVEIRDGRIDNDDADLD